MRLDRWLTRQPQLNRRLALRALAAGRVRINGQTVRDPLHEVGPFDAIALTADTLADNDATPGEIRLQAPRRPRHVLLNKPAGVVTACHDPEHPTVIDVLRDSLESRGEDDGWLEEIHHVGRLDRATTGALLLTNDGDVSSRISDAGLDGPAKRYRMGLEQPLSEAAQAEAISRVAQGVLLANDARPTLPARLEFLAADEARLTLHEGRHHHVKRLWRTLGNRVVWLHRESVAGLSVAGLAVGDWRELTRDECLRLGAALAHE
ncbi:pseudouridine synthase [Cobetia sp. 10Alg 146]|jgi:16S rRNA pseudouridine516 synthase|uniref:pseudouridine synthase n=1 Tax=Cobetia sp. 10Alg 146 TaxID=3040019 RepID=UPI00244B04E9|nr:pseudouridine synthase [Cobetia sp. 10Alg 146]MDH2291808.1 pseudouridine synthase [Cobetia sp. 10Alg 146]